MPNYKVKEYMHSFEIDPDDQYEFPRDQHLTYEKIINWEDTNEMIDVYGIAKKALVTKYAVTDGEMEDFENELSLFQYNYSDMTNRHYLTWEIDDGEMVDFICISIEEI